MSVIIPAYNRAHRLPDAIESVLRQGRDDVEIVVVDDGSTDNTREVAGQFGTTVKYVHQLNAGVGAARNSGIRHATKEFVAFLDSDDRWLDFKLSAQLALFEACPAVGLVFSDFEIEKPGSGSVPHGASIWAGRDLSFPEMKRLTLARPTGKKGKSWLSDSVDCWAGPMYRQLLDELPILTSSVIVRRSALTDRTWYTERVALFEDWEFFAQVARNSGVGYIAAATTINVGHADPGRVSKCSALDRALSYQSLVERVWLADPTFVAAHGSATRSAYARALLAVARESVLVGRPDLALTAMRAWHTWGSEERQTWAAIYSFCASVPAGRMLLKNVLRGRALARHVTGAGKHLHGSVNPAA